MVRVSELIERLIELATDHGDVGAGDVGHLGGVVVESSAKDVDLTRQIIITEDQY